MRLKKAAYSFRRTDVACKLVLHELKCDAKCDAIAVFDVPTSAALCQTQTVHFRQIFLFIVCHNHVMQQASDTASSLKEIPHLT